MDPKRAEAIYDQIGKYSVELPSDAWVLGPKHIHELIGLTRGYINSVTMILQEILQERQALDRAKHAEETIFRVEADRLLAEDDRVRRAPNIEDRKSNINLILRERLSVIHGLEARLLDLGYVEKAVRHRYNELKATMTDIRAQRALIRDAIDSGSFYGDETETSRGSRGPGHVPVASNGGFSEDEIDRSMAELDDMLVAGVVEPSSVETPPPEAPAPPPEPAAPPPEPPKPKEDDYSDLIDGIESGAATEVAEESSPKSEGSEDPALTNFLDGDDLSNLFDE